MEARRRGVGRGDKVVTGQVLMTQGENRYEEEIGKEQEV